MAVSPQIAPQVGISRYRQAIRAGELLANDLDQTCPNCQELNCAGQVFCLECGTHLTEQRKPIPRGGAWSTSA